MTFKDYADIVFEIGVVTAISFIVQWLKNHEKALKIVIYGMDRHVKGIPAIIREMNQEEDRYKN
jgi:hypothetical protein